jgi:hypothetical protein
MLFRSNYSKLRSGARQQAGGVVIGGRWILLLLLALGLVACQSDSEPTAAPEATSEVQDPETSAAVTAIPTPISIEEAWQTSLHAQTFVVGEDGSNSSCARCHAPVNWVPTMDDMPESCLACKFEVKPPPPLIPEEEWEHVPCKVCHQVKKDEVQDEYAWLEIAAIEEYADVASTSELCLKCHAGVDLPDHEPIQVSEEHADTTCTECHDAHATTATCSSSDCHEDLEPIPGHDEDHQMVSCVACHDADNLQVGPNEEEGFWVTFMSVSSDGEETITPYTSHNMQVEAPCDRCHFPDNAWGLSEAVSTEP